MNLDLDTALAMVTADADPDKRMTAIDVLNMEKQTVDSLSDVVRGLVALNRIQTRLLANALTERNQLATPPQPAVSQDAVLGILGKAVAAYKMPGRAEG